VPAFSRPEEFDEILFRSTAEARWAIVFWCLGIKYFYEPEWFVTDHGGYRPDFHMPGLGLPAPRFPNRGLIGEVKPSLDYDPHGVAKLRSLIETRRQERGVVLPALHAGEMRVLLVAPWLTDLPHLRDDIWEDDGALLLTCPNGYHHDFQPYRQLGCAQCGTEGGYWTESDKIEEAYAFARSYRFDRR
jgi:hypothetical protein